MATFQYLLQSDHFHLGFDYFALCLHFPLFFCCAWIRYVYIKCYSEYVYCNTFCVHREQLDYLVNSKSITNENQLQIIHQSIGAIVNRTEIHSLFFTLRSRTLAIDQITSAHSLCCYLQK